MNEGLKQHINDFKELTFLAYDAGRITGSRAGELMGLDLLDFRDKYEDWRSSQKMWDQLSRNKTATTLGRLRDIAEAVAAATDNGETYLHPDVALLDSLEEAIAAVRVLRPEAEKGGATP